jgi:hypothetical protein
MLVQNTAPAIELHEISVWDTMVADEKHGKGKDKSDKEQTPTNKIQILQVLDQAIDSSRSRTKDGNHGYSPKLVLIMGATFPGNFDISPGSLW